MSFGDNGERTARVPGTFRCFTARRIVENGTRERARKREGKMWGLPPSDTVLHVLSLVALAAQAMTAALVEWI